MIKYFSLLLGSFAGTLLLRERRKRLALERLGAATLESLLDAIGANNPDTGAHVRRVADYSIELACAADLDKWTQHSVERVALFHDIGKIDGAIADIVNETTKLSAEERRSIMEHPRKGAEVLAPLASFFPELPEGVLSHHERWDGTGYPRKLKGEAIPIEARIVAIADTFDAITQSRSYRHSRSIETATEIISSGRGTQFDPDLADLFLSPPVMTYVAKAMAKSLRPRRSGGRRKRCGSSADAPDITFRWRATTPVRLPAGH
ncbi:MAG: HD domain-containing phosphohydrolase [Gemmatimonadaceae bacterium]